MPKPPVPDHVQEFLREPHPAVMATVKPDGSPHTAVTWYDWVDGRALVSMDVSRVRLRYLRSDPRVSLTVVERGNWYRAATILGRAELHDDEGLVDVDRVRERVSAWIEPEQWYAWDATAAAPKDEAADTAM